MFCATLSKTWSSFQNVSIALKGVPSIKRSGYLQLNAKFAEVMRSFAKETKSSLKKANKVHDLLNNPVFIWHNWHEATCFVFVGWWYSWSVSRCCTACYEAWSIWGDNLVSFWFWLALCVKKHVWHSRSILSPRGVWFHRTIRSRPPAKYYKYPCLLYDVLSYSAFCVELYYTNSHEA